IVHLILKDNTGQNQALDLIEESAQTQHFDYCDLIQKLERDAGLKRPTVFLDTDKNLRNQRTYLTRSEMAIILSYSKILLKRIILQNFETFEKHAPQSMQTYFPKAIVDQFGDSVMDHLLYKELIALTLTNQIISKHGVLWMKDLNFEATDNITRQHMIHAINAQLHIT
ncbi:MAG: NAD-glutamate dehydrogenase, partial [Alphaproteobacteria bacterium]|nr:NAD-glutamate dehydrogenase [Alphaproteobacteria bacterium]